jgi:hypothetical protein
MIIGFQISSYAQIVNLGLPVFPEHVTPNLAPLHLVPDSSSLTLEGQVLSPELAKLPENFENFLGSLVLEVEIVIRCSATVSSLTIWAI